MTAEKEAEEGGRSEEGVVVAVRARYLVYFYDCAAIGYSAAG